VSKAEPASDEVIRGLVYTHNRANANTAEVHRACSTLDALVEVLVERGVIAEEELETHREAAAASLRRRYVERGMAVAMQEFGVSKYDFQGGAVVDCENRVHLCKAACCKLPLALSKEDIQEGAVRWELHQPYMLAHGEDGYCVHMNRETHRCGVYNRRPIPCRGYDCSKDERIWLDFENKVINPQINEPDWPANLQRDTQADEAG
jgi:Fe-S-cluster containining protein